MFVQLNEKNRIVGTADYNCFPENTSVIEFDFPEDFDFNNQHEFIIVNGKLIESESEISKQFRERNEQAEKRESFLPEASDTIAEQDDAICALYEENLALKATAADQDDAICYLFEQMTEGK